VLLACPLLVDMPESRIVKAFALFDCFVFLPLFLHRLFDRIASGSLHYFQANDPKGF
jgi:hypothetical protein